MTDEQLQSSWPDLGAVVIELRRLAHTALADRLIDVTYELSPTGVQAWRRVLARLSGRKT